MKLSLPIDALKAAGSGFSTRGGTLTSSLTLVRNPVQPLEAATKSYIDTAITSISANAINTGTLSEQRFPSFSGDVVKATSSGVISLNNTGVTVGTYTKVIIDSKGRVTSGGDLTVDDIPSLNWNKLANLPTTIADYGITDALAKDGDTLTGYLNLPSNPTQTLHAVSKGYVDSVSNTGVNAVAGDLIARFTNLTPTGFLRCNGGEVNKITYSDLYNVIGETYSLTSQIGSGQPWRQQYDINTQQSTDINDWSISGNLPAGFGWAQSFVTNSRVYLLGGYNQNGYLTTVYTAPIDTNGVIGSWTTGTPLPEAISNAQAIVTKNRVYLLSGTSVNKIYTATINVDGTIGEWSIENTLPVQVAHSNAIITKNRIYLIGGYNNGAFSSAIYTAVINSDGTLGVWSTTASFPINIAHSQVVVTKNRVYVIGGYSDSTELDAIYTAPIFDDGVIGSWSVAGSVLPVTLSYSQVVVTKNKVYLLGGYNNGGTISTVYTASINADGTFGSWTTGTSLPDVLRNSQVIVTNSKIYLLGGHHATSWTGVIYSASFSGGLNDYSPYYNGTITTTDPANFKLPDFTSNEVNGLYYFVKY